MTTWSLRSATADDLGPIMAIETAVFEHDAWSAESMAAELVGPDRAYLVAIAGDEPHRSGAAVVGYAGLAVGGEQADVQTIAVAEPARGHGVGRALLDQLLQLARLRGAAEVFLEVRSDNPVARALYRAAGFERIAIRPRYYQPDGVDAVVMRLVLPQPKARLAAAPRGLPPTAVDPSDAGGGLDGAGDGGGDGD